MDKACLRQGTGQGELSIEKLDTQNQIADIFTKPAVNTCLNNYEGVEVLEAPHIFTWLLKIKLCYPIMFTLTICSRHIFCYLVNIEIHKVKSMCGFLFTSSINIVAAVCQNEGC